MTLVHIDNQTEPAWRCESRAVSPLMAGLRLQPADWYVPARSEQGPDGVAHYLEVVLTARVLMCWTGSPLAAQAVVGIDTVANRVQLKTGDAVSCQINERPLTDNEREFVQQERLIEANEAIAAGLRGGGKVALPLSAPQPPYARKPEIDETILWHVQQRIVDEVDPKLKSAPSASLVFTRYCRDRLTLAEMGRRYRWSYRTLKLRKAILETFLRERFNKLTLAAFFVDRSVFRAAEQQLKNYRVHDNAGG